MSVNVIPVQFIAQNIHFGINLFAALACLAAGLLYLDAWSERHAPGEFAKTLGFFLLTVGLLITGASWGSPGLLDLTGGSLELLGYLSIALGRLLSPLQIRPKTTGYTAAIAPLSIPGIAIDINVLVPLAAAAASLLYWRASTVGLERHLRPLAVGLSIFTLSNALALAQYWQASDNPILQQLGSPFGPFWILQHLTLVAGTFILGRWVWRYLTKRLISQLFLAVSSLTFAIVLIAAVSTTTLLLASLQRDALASLETATKVLGYTVDSQIASTRADAEILAQSPDLITATTGLDRTRITTVASGTLVQKQLSEVVITTDTGVVLGRASDPERYGDSLSNDPLVERALAGTTASGVAQGHPSAIAPAIVITTASPIRSQGQVVGVVLASVALDNAFVDGLKHTTGLDSTVYSRSARAATTLTGTDGTSRSLGVKETNTEVISQTLSHGQVWRGVLTVSGQPFLAVYLPLKNIDNRVVGMLSVGQPQSAVLQTATQAVKLTFLSATAWLVVIMIPVYIIARGITRQLH